MQVTGLVSEELALSEPVSLSEADVLSDALAVSLVVFVVSAWFMGFVRRPAQ